MNGKEMLYMDVIHGCLTGCITSPLLGKNREFDAYSNHTFVGPQILTLEFAGLGGGT